MKLQVKIKKLTDTATIPSYGTKYSAGMDLHADIKEEVKLFPGEHKLIGTGLAMALANTDELNHQEESKGNCIPWSLWLLPKSGLGHKEGLVLGNLVGIVDNDYRGEIFISAWNRSDNLIKIKPGQQIAQGLLLPTLQAEFQVVDSLDETERGEGGFGHTTEGSAC